MKYIEPFQVQIKPPVHKNASYKCITCIYDYKGLIKIIFIQRRSSANSTKKIKMVERNVIQILGLPRNKIHINHNIMKAFNLTEPKLKIDNNFYLILFYFFLGGGVFGTRTYQRKTFNISQPLFSATGSERKLIYSLLRRKTTIRVLICSIKRQPFRADAKIIA